MEKKIITILYKDYTNKYDRNLEIIEGTYNEADKTIAVSVDKDFEYDEERRDEVINSYKEIRDTKEKIKKLELIKRDLDDQYQAANREKNMIELNAVREKRNKIDKEIKALRNKRDNTYVR